MTALRGKSGKFFSPLSQHKLPPGKSVTSIPSPCLLIEENRERSCTLWWWAEKKELWIQRGGKTRNIWEQQYLDAIFVLMAQSWRKYKLTISWCSQIRSPSTTFRIKAQNLGTRNATEIKILTLLLFMRSDISTVWKSHCGLRNQFVYILCVHVLNVAVRRTQHIQASAIPLPKFPTRSTTHPVKYTSHCPCPSLAIIFKGKRSRHATGNAIQPANAWSVLRQRAGDIHDTRA